MATMTMSEMIDSELPKWPIVSNTAAITPKALLNQERCRHRSYSVLFRIREELAVRHQCAKTSD
jgi:hypothetical protein